MSDKNIYTSIKETFDNFEMQPSIDVWQNIDNSIRRIKKQKMIRRAIFASVAVALIIIVPAILIMNNNNNVDENIYLVDSNKVADVVPVMDNVVSKIQDNTTQELVTVEQSNSKIIDNSESNNNLVSNGSSVINDEVQVQMQEDNIVNDNGQYDVDNAAHQPNNNTDIPVIELVENENTADTMSDTAKEHDNATEHKQQQKLVEVVDNNTKSTMQDNNSSDNEKTENNYDDDNEKILHVPSAFMPDGDESTYFCVKGKNVKTYEIRIYNRQRIMVYHSKNINEKLDGKYNGEPLKMGTYVYMIQCYTIDNKFHTESGTITLIRQK